MLVVVKNFEIELLFSNLALLLYVKTEGILLCLYVNSSSVNVCSEGQEISLQVHANIPIRNLCQCVESHICK